MKKKERLEEAKLKWKESYLGKRMEQLKTHKENEESAIEAEEKDRKTE